MHAAKNQWGMTEDEISTFMRKIEFHESKEDLNKSEEDTYRKSVEDIFHEVVPLSSNFNPEDQKDILILEIF